MKKTNKFLSLAMLLSATTSQIAFCMQQENGVEIWENPVASYLDQESAYKFTGSDILSEEERAIELEKESRIGSINVSIKKNTEKLKKSACDLEAIEKRDKNLGNLSILPNEVLNIICESLKLEDLRDLRKCSKILNELVDENLKTPVEDSNKATSVTIDLNDVSFTTKFHEKFKIIQEKMLLFIKGTDRTLTINFIPPFGLSEYVGDYFLVPATGIWTRTKRYPSITIDRDNIYRLESNILDNVISRKDIANSRKDIAKSYIKKNKTAIVASVALTTAIISFLICDKIIVPIGKRFDEKTIERLEKGDFNFYDKIMLYSKSLIIGRKNAEKLYKTMSTMGRGPIYQKIVTIMLTSEVALLSAFCVDRKIKKL